MLDVTPENLARLLPSGTEMTERVTTLTPKQARKPLSRLCWIGTTSRGLLLIELRNPLCISGASLTSVPDGAGRLPFTFLAQNDRGRRRRMTQPDEFAAAPQNPESTETPSIDYDALAEALTPIISAIIARQVNQRRYT